MQRQERQNNRLLATVIAELRQAVLAEGTRLLNEPARSVEQPAASHVPSSVEQPADPFTSINALTVWLKAQGD